LIGDVIANYAGPSVIFSFVIAGLATFLAGMSYAELGELKKYFIGHKKSTLLVIKGARVPRSGSAYAYIYVTIGEFFAFIMGWDLIMEYMIGSAGTANALSKYINSLSGNKIQDALKSSLSMNIPTLASYPDLLALGLVLIVIGI
jgi:amino acid transporter